MEHHYLGKAGDSGCSGTNNRQFVDVGDTYRQSLVRITSCIWQMGHDLFKHLQDWSKVGVFKCYSSRTTRDELSDSVQYLTEGRIMTLKLNKKAEHT